jgi:hypothetical protein
MSTTFEKQVRGFGLALLFCSWSLPASAQSTTAPPSSGPLVIERVKSGWLIAPDVKVTEVDDETSTLAGAYGGWITDNTFLVGGGGYWLVNRSDDREMAYGGLVLEWLARTDRLLGFGVRGLIGGGVATLGTTVSGFPRTPDGRGERGGRDARDVSSRSGDRLTTTRVAFEEGFVIAEPQVNLLVNFTDRLRLSVGIGYRLIGADDFADDRLSGTTGTIAVQWGGGRSR